MVPDYAPLTVVLATDSFLIGDGLAALLADRPEVKVVGRARDHEELLALVGEHNPDAVIVSIRTPVISSMTLIDVARRLRAQHPLLGIVVISDRGNGFALELLRAGASRIAYLLDERLPNMDTVLGALHEVRSGQTVLDPSIVDALIRRRDGVVIDDLTVREIDVLEAMAHGLSNSAIAKELNVSLKAVEKYVTIIFRKLGVSDQGGPGPSLIDRRVTAVLAFLRAHSSPFSDSTGTESRSTD